MNEVRAAQLRSIIVRGSMPVPETDCWMWVKGYGTHGYGSLWDPDERRTTTAPRLAFRAWHGELELGEMPRHTCNWKPCCNPNHLIRGTQLENMADWTRTGGSAKKLTPERVLEIKVRLKLGEKQLTIAIDHGVSEESIRLIAVGKTWRRIVA